MEKSLTFASVASKNTAVSALRQKEPMPAELTKAQIPPAPPTPQVTGLASPFTTRPAGTESYAEAVKTTHSVCLNGVPVNPEKRRTRGQLTGSGAGSFSNSTLHEQESVLSSWADDDKCFFDSIRISTEELAKAKVPGIFKGHAPCAEKNSESIGGFRRGRGGRGWTMITGGETNKNNKRRRKHNNSNSGRVHHRACGNNYGSGSGVEQTYLSGGRFDALADVALKRHL